MGLATEMKNLSEEMLSSFKERVKENEELVANVGKKLQQYRNEQENTAKTLNANAAELRNDLAVGEKDRLGKYGQLIGSIQKDIEAIEKDVQDSKDSANALINNFSEARKVLSNDLDNFFAAENKSRAENEQSRMADYGLFIGKISDEVSSIFNYTNEMLEKFGSEHKEMSAELREELSKARNERFEYTHTLLKNIQQRIAEISNENLSAARKLKNDLDQGEADRLKGYNELFDRISREVSDLRKSTSSLLDNYSKDRSEGVGHWRQMQNEIAAIRAGELASIPESVEKVVEESVVKAPVAPVVPVVVKEVPVFEEPQPVVIVDAPKVSDESTLEEKILNYINSHYQGVKVSDMEEPLHETRMKIGFAAKCLLDAGKVSKVENLYYPIKKTYK